MRMGDRGAGGVPAVFSGRLSSDLAFGPGGRTVGICGPGGSGRSAFGRLGIGRPVAFADGFRLSARQMLRLHEAVAPSARPSMDDGIRPRLRGRSARRADASAAAAGCAVVVGGSGFRRTCDGRRAGRGAGQAKAFLGADFGTVRAAADRIRGVGAPAEG